jgi:Uma2 family endonuclease
MPQPPLTVRRWNRAEYDRLVELGAFDGDPIELLGGQLIIAEPQRPYHASAVASAEYALRAALPQGWIVRTQSPMGLDDESEPEPDLVVLPGPAADRRLAHPIRPVLTIEVAESSLVFDREIKGSLYARAGIEDYWILNLVDHALEVCRDPAPDALAPYGWRYQVTMTAIPPAVVTPLAFPTIGIDVAALFP